MRLFLEFPASLTPQIAPWLPIRWYGLLSIIAIVVTIALFRHEARRSRLTDDRDEVTVFFTWVVSGLLIGGRLFYVLVIGTASEYLTEPWRIVWPFDDGSFTGLQGMSYHGGVLGAAVATALFCKTRNNRFFAWADALALSAPLGYALARIGNFVNGELVGRVTAAPWAVLFPGARRVPIEESWAQHIAEQAGIAVRPEEALVNLPRHPSQLYGALLAGLVVWLVLWFGFRKRRMFPGALTGLYLAGYGVARLIVGYFQGIESTRFALTFGARAESHHMVGVLTSLSGGQIVSVGMTAVGVCILVFARLYRPELPYVSTYTE
ncbi:MAG: prolipoprotein diacylglyceryl transferase [Spirochaetales bacterium]